MRDAYDLVLDITSHELPQGEMHRALRDFSRELGWRPSYYIVEAPFVDETAKAHLVVEHGLEPSAVITFLGTARPFSAIQLSEQNRLLEISYNNLADWHLCVEPTQVSFCYNRTRPFTLIGTERISRSNMDTLRNESFDQVVGRRPNPNLPNLDEALMRTVSKWKRSLAADMRDRPSNEHYSALFNAIIFARAVEDHNRRRERLVAPLLLEEWEREQGSLRATIRRCLERFVHTAIPRELLDDEKLAPFDSLDWTTVQALLYEFYYNQHAPYNYNFSLMSKHALSRIYEHYSSLLVIEDSPQASFFPPVPDEDWNKTYGSVYTPQFIARFLARFVREQMPPGAFRRVMTVDPACGSGIFLRTMLELQCDPLHDGVTWETVQTAFRNVVGLDVDENATNATRLSLSLLYLTLMGRLPERLQIITAESIAYFQDHPELADAFDAVIVNPPFVSLGAQTDAMRQRISEFMGVQSKGRIDMYLAFLRLGLEMLRPGGYGLYVLPHSFLVSKSAAAMRKRLASETWIRCLADLSAIRVFGELGSYIVLLIFQKKPQAGGTQPRAAVIKCQDLVGHALEDYLDGLRIETKLYSVYEVEQTEFMRDEWVVLPKTESAIRRRLQQFPTLEEYAHVREGLITGADDIFIVDQRAVPAGEQGAYVRLLPDRAMTRYHVPESTGRMVIYPFADGERLDECHFRQRFPTTWDYLSKHRSKLESRRPVERGQLDWWLPVRPRPPERLLRPKVVSPHLVIMPKFSLDATGEYAVSRSPLIYPREAAVESELLRFLVAVLNSPVCYWYISTHAHKYSRGYSMLEPKTLKQVPIPDPNRVPPTTMLELLGLVNHRLADPSALDTEKQIDQLVADLYGLPSKERHALGIED